MKALSRFSAVLLALCTSAQAQTLEEERVQELYDFLESALSCDVASGTLKVSLAQQRAQLQDMLTSAALELGEAMLAGELSYPDPAKGRRCLVQFNLAPQPGLSDTQRTFLIGFELGKVRSCLNNLFWYEVGRSVPTGPRVGGNSIQEIQDRQRVQQFALNRFRELGCDGLRAPD